MILLLRHLKARPPLLKIVRMRIKGYSV